MSAPLRQAAATGPEPPVAPDQRSAMRWIVAGSLRYRYLVVASAVVLMVLGFVTIPSMRVDTFPEFAPPRIVVQTPCLGLSTTDVEQLVTMPLEQALGGLSGLTDLRSKSVPQLSYLELLFTPETDLLTARRLVQERLTSVARSLPNWASPPVMLEPVSATGRAMQIGMTAPGHSLMQMSMAAYWTIRARLLQVPGVANVAIWNERMQMLTVHVRPDRLTATGVALEKVMSVTSDAVDSGLLKFSDGAVIGTGGVVESATARVPVENVLNIVTPSDLAKVPVSRAAGRTVRLGDLGRVGYDYPPLVGSAVVEGQPGLLLVVEKVPWANTLQLTAGVEDALRELEPGLPGVRFDTEVFQQANFIELSIHNLTESMLLGFVLVVVILFLFLFEWRVALISLLTIPLSLMAALLVLDRFGATVNTMTLAGLVIALGAVVDDAIIDVENIVRRLREARLAGSRRPTAAIILDASIEVRSPIVYATLIIVAAIVPVFLLQGLTGAFFRPMATAYTLAIVASMVVALTVTPALTLMLLRRARIERRASPLVRVLQRWYTATLAPLLRRRAAAVGVLGIVAAVVVAGVLVVPRLGQSLFPEFEEPDLLVHWVAAPGTSVAEMERITADVNARLAGIPGVRSTAGHIGQARLGEEVAGVNLGENWLSIDPSADRDATLARVRVLTLQYPGLFRDSETYLDERIAEVLTGGKSPVIVRLFGNDLKVLEQVAADVQGRLSGIDGLVDAHADLITDVPEVDVRVDIAKARALGLKPGDVRRAAATMVAGEEVGNIFGGNRAYNVAVWSDPAARGSVTAVENLPIHTPAGRYVRLRDVASVALRPSPNAVERQGGSRYIDVGAAVSGRDIGSVVGDVQQVLARVQMPEGYHAEVLGEFAEARTAQARLLTVSLVAALLVLLLLITALRSRRLGVLVFVTLPSALVGGVLAAWLAGGVLSLGSLVGFFTVFGIAARNGILLVNHFQHLVRHEGETLGPAMVLRGARERLSPILMTSLATGLALVPLVVLGARPGHEIEYPLAVVVVGGLVTSTLLTLFVVPSLYLFVEGRGTRASAGAPAPGVGPEGVAGRT